MSAVDPEYAERERRRSEQKSQMHRDMKVLLADVETLDVLAAHPRPWTWAVTYHDGVGIQFCDASGQAVLPGLLYDPELAAALFKTLSTK